MSRVGQKRLKGIDKEVARILSEEHDVEHRGRPRANCPRCQEEGHVAVRRYKERVTGPELTPGGRVPKAGPEHLVLHTCLERMREKPGEWVTVRTMGTENSARQTARRYRKRIPPRVVLTVEGNEILGRYEPVGSPSEPADETDARGSDVTEVRVRELERQVANLRHELAKLKERVDSAAGALSAGAA